MTQQKTPGIKECSKIFFFLMKNGEKNGIRQKSKPGVLQTLLAS